jgi:hypothetical protein
LIFIKPRKTIMKSYIAISMMVAVALSTNGVRREYTKVPPKAISEVFAEFPCHNELEIFNLIELKDFEAQVVQGKVLAGIPQENNLMNSSIPSKLDPENSNLKFGELETTFTEKPVYLPMELLPTNINTNWFGTLLTLKTVSEPFLLVVSMKKIPMILSLISVKVMMQSQLESNKDSLNFPSKPESTLNKPVNKLQNVLRLRSTLTL